MLERFLRIEELPLTPRKEAVTALLEANQAAKQSPTPVRIFELDGAYGD